MSYPQRIRMFVSMLRRARDIEAFERRFEEELETNELFRPVAKQCRAAIRIWRATNVAESN